MSLTPPLQKLPPVVALVGSTACGKTDLALRIAQRAKAHIISCDSLLVYKDLNIGTAKPSIAELNSVPHHAINIVTADVPYTAGDFVRHTRPIIDDLVAKQIPVLIVGGTGFYLKALLFGIWDAPPTQPQFRATLDEKTQHLPLDERGPFLYKELLEKDPTYAAKISPHDHYRVVRALEIIFASGKTVTEQSNESRLQNPFPHAYEVFGIRRHPLDLQRRILERANAMFAAGLVAETKSLLTKYPEVPKSMKCVGYSEVIEHLQGRMTLMECRERVEISTRQLAKKQKTFFKTFPGIQWVDLPANEEQLEHDIFSLLTGREPTHRVI